MRPYQWGRIYIATTDQAIQDTAVIIGTILIHSYVVVVLFQSNSTLAFLAKKFVDRISVKLDDLGYDLVVSTRTKVGHTTSVCMRLIVIEI